MMKKAVLILTLVATFFSCKNTKENNELIGDWKLVEILVDPGNGSGTFNEVTSEKIFTFNADGTITSNGSLCNLSVDLDKPTSGTYDETAATFTSTNCSDSNQTFSFKLVKDELIVSYPCVEPCKAKFKKQ